MQFIHDFERAVSAEAARCKVDGIVCGHIHKAEIREIDGVLYCNDGDWVESCTALAETAEGRLEIVHWGYLLGEMRELEQARAPGVTDTAAID